MLPLNYNADSMHIKPISGTYRVKTGRSLVWQTDRGPEMWARPGQYVRVDYPLGEYLQRTRQMGRLEKVDSIPAKASVASDLTAPPQLRALIQASRSGGTEAAKAVAATAKVTTAGVKAPVLPPAESGAAPGEAATEPGEAQQAPAEGAEGAPQKVAAPFAKPKTGGK